MRFVQIPKKSGNGFRQIACPSKKEKHELRAYLPMLNALSKKYCNFNTVHGFMPYRSPVTNAKIHIDKKFSLTIDLKDWFDTLKIEHVKHFFKDDIFVRAGEIPFLDSFDAQKFLDKVFVKDQNGVPRAYQGLPTSPMLCNLGAAAMDEEIRLYILRKNTELEESIVWSRYADDMTFSFDKYETYEILKKEISDIITNNGFQVNPKKIYLQNAKFGRRVTGINVTEKDIRVSRKIRRRIRVLKHKIAQLEKASKITSDTFLADTIRNRDIKPSEAEIMAIAKIFNQKHDHISKRFNALSKQLKSLQQWQKLKMPRQPLNHTLKILKKIYDSIKAREILSQGLDPKMYSRVQRYGYVSIDYQNEIRSLFNKNQNKAGFNRDVQALLEKFYSYKVITKNELRSFNDIVQMDDYKKNININILDIKDVLGNDA